MWTFEHREALEARRREGIVMSKTQENPLRLIILDGTPTTFTLDDTSMKQTSFMFGQALDELARLGEMSPDDAMTVITRIKAAIAEIREHVVTKARTTERDSNLHTVQ